MEISIVIMVGLTGVGKSSALAALLAAGTPLHPLPNRRTLTDTFIIPEVQRSLGRPGVAVTDRLKRFALTRHYREMHPGGMAHALEHHLETTPPQENTLLFDNLRGLEEVQHAVQTFPNARFIVLDAPPVVRLRRLTLRADRFDTVAATRLDHTFAERLSAIPAADAVFDLYEVARLEANAGVSEEALLDAVAIIVTEKQHYDSAAALAYLRETLDDTRLLYLDTGTLTVAEVGARIRGWL